MSNLRQALYGPTARTRARPRKAESIRRSGASALLQAAGGTLPVIKKNERGVYVIVESGAGAHSHAAAAPAPKPAAPGPPATPTTPTPAAAKAATVAEKSKAAPPGPKPAAQPDRNLNRRTTYAGVVEKGQVPGESKEQKIERLKQVVAGAKQRAEEGGAPKHTAAVTVVDSSAEADLHRPAAEAQAQTGAASAAPLSKSAASASPVAGAEVPADLAPDKV